MRGSATINVLRTEQLNSAATPATKDKVMKIQNRIVIVAATGIAALFLSQARAQIRTGGGDGIAASPKLRVMLDERARSAAVQEAVPTVADAGYRAVGGDGIAASPKLREMLTAQARNQVVIAPSAVATTGYRANGQDGIAASPKLRTQLDERSGTAFQIAPVK